jgi:hypothetical protein
MPELTVEQALQQAIEAHKARKVQEKADHRETAIQNILVRAIYD